MVDVNTELPFTPITIVSQDNATITFTISNPFGEDVSSVYYQYATEKFGSIKCYSESPFSTCPVPIEVTAHCLTGAAKSLTIVDIWFVDPTVIDSSDMMTIPACCEPDEQHTTIPTVHYTFKLYCESWCEGTAGTPKRTLTGHAESTIKNAVDFGRVAREDAIPVDLHQEKKTNQDHFCSSVDYPCGDKSDMVHVCHYSTRDGYQTYCVPESDSDVIAYVPKDYCGPCVGGYQPITYRK
jgi:hypothetical protein